LSNRCLPVFVSRLAACSLGLLIPIAGGSLATSVGIAVAQKPAATGKAKLGETIFQAQCIGCHNKQPGDTTPFGPPNLHGIIGAAKPQITPKEAAETIKTGKGVMPAFADKLSTQDISNLVAYLKTQ
jgi:mono/diheme cytochrome c family protein